jgi:hypothetical protein
MQRWEGAKSVPVVRLTCTRCGAIIREATLHWWSGERGPYQATRWKNRKGTTFRRIGPVGSLRYAVRCPKPGCGREYDPPDDELRRVVIEAAARGSTTVNHPGATLPNVNK